MKVSELIAELSKLDGDTEAVLAMPFDEEEFDVFEIGSLELMEDDDGNSAVLLIADTSFEDDGEMEDGE